MCRPQAEERAKLELRRRQKEEAEAIALQALGRRWSAAGDDGLYRRGMEKKMQLWAKAAAARSQAVEEELKTLRPPEITEKARRLRRQSKDWERMAIGEGDIRAIKLAQLAAETEEREFAECTFRPELASRSEKLMRQRTAVMRSAGVSAHATLYADATRRQMRQRQYAEWLPDDVTFQPSVRSMCPRPARLANVSFHSRLFPPFDPSSPRGISPPLLPSFPI